MHNAITTIVAALTLSAMAAAQTAEPLFDPVRGYRIAHYRGVVGPAPEGVARIDTTQAFRLWRRKAAIFIDVNPAPGAVRDAATGRWTLAEPHSSIPGAHWFPESGRGQLAQGIAPWLLDGVRRLHRAAPDRPVVIFCLADCWMSWNAALRLHREGYRDIRWFAEGIDGWRDAGLRLEPAACVGMCASRRKNRGIRR
jgi:PQQ-dependent catabolism-associated CXXCW motif protein